MIKIDLVARTLRGDLEVYEFVGIANNIENARLAIKMSLSKMMPKDGYAKLVTIEDVVNEEEKEDGFIPIYDVYNPNGSILVRNINFYVHQIPLEQLYGYNENYSVDFNYELGKFWSNI